LSPTLTKDKTIVCDRVRTSRTQPANHLRNSSANYFPLNLPRKSLPVTVRATQDPVPDTLEVGIEIAMPCVIGPVCSEQPGLGSSAPR
jgi:hypothetical protein